MNLKEQLGNPNTKVLAHLVGWFQKTAGQHIGMYDSADPRTVRSQIRMAKQVGIDGFVLDWYGPGNDLINRVALELAVQCEAEGFEFSVMLDAGIFKWITVPTPGTSVFSTRQQALYDAIDYAMDNLAVSKAYTQIKGSPLFWEFGLQENGIDMVQLFSKYSELNMLLQGIRNIPSVGTYAWIGGFPDGITALKTYLAKKQSGIQVPCVYFGFDDNSPTIPGTSVWGGARRLISPRNGDTWNDCVKAIKAAGQFPMVQIVTWNDYEEGTAIEPFVKALTNSKL